MDKAKRESAAIRLLLVWLHGRELKMFPLTSSPGHENYKESIKIMKGIQWMVDIASFGA